MPDERADFTIIHNDQIKMGKAGADKFRQFLRINAGKFKIGLESRRPGFLENAHPAICIVLPGRIHQLVNPGQAEMQIARGCGTEVKVIRRQHIRCPAAEDVGAPPGCL